MAIQRPRTPPANPKERRTRRGMRRGVGDENDDDGADINVLMVDVLCVDCCCCCCYSTDWTTIAATPL